MSVLSRSPPNTPTGTQKGFGRYCIRAKSRVLTKCGNTYINITGYDTEPSIGSRVEKVAKYKGRNHHLDHTEVEMVFLTDSRLIADGTIFMDYVECNSTLIIPPWNFR